MELLDAADAFRMVIRLSNLDKGYAFARYAQVLVFTPNVNQ